MSEMMQDVCAGFGLDGPYCGKPAYVPSVMCDSVVGEIAAGVVMAAPVQRGRSGSEIEALLTAGAVFASEGSI